MRFPSNISPRAPPLGQWKRQRSIHSRHVEGRHHRWSRTTGNIQSLLRDDLSSRRQQTTIGGGKRTRWSVCVRLQWKAKASWLAHKCLRQARSAIILTEWLQNRATTIYKRFHFVLVVNWRAGLCMYALVHACTCTVYLVGGGLIVEANIPVQELED